MANPLPVPNDVPPPGPEDDDTDEDHSDAHCILWVVQPGQTLGSLASSVGFSPTEILRINQITQLTPGQVIRLPIHRSFPCCD